MCLKPFNVGRIAHLPARASLNFIAKTTAKLSACDFSTVGAGSGSVRPFGTASLLRQNGVVYSPWSRGAEARCRDFARGRSLTSRDLHRYSASEETPPLTSNGRVRVGN